MISMECPVSTHFWNKYVDIIVRSNKLSHVFIIVDEDIDGIPMDDDDSISARNKEDDKKSAMPAGFVPSRWETVDPDQVSKFFG